MQNVLVVQTFCSQKEEESSIDGSMYVSDCEYTYIGYLIERFDLIGNAIISGH
jgi:hypothetical protein